MFPHLMDWEKQCQELTRPREFKKFCGRQRLGVDHKCRHDSPVESGEWISPIHGRT